ncbi:MAG: hypothetical protein JWN52_80 [Actinomycetia bacterium]|jgi:hypothetical protein|nr:hypothetical protein [Actinomycetes bacterium]
MRIEPTWADTCPGSYALAPKAFVPEFASVTSLNVRQELAVVGRSLAINGKRLRDEQPSLNRQSQDEQGRSVFTGTATGPIALTAHMDATKPGVSGPYPWRPPV